MLLLVGCANIGNLIGNSAGGSTPPSNTGEALIYSLNPDGNSYTVMGSSSKLEKTLTIPSTHNGLPVTQIAARAFIDCGRLISVTIGANIKSIGDTAFLSPSLIEVVNRSKIDIELGSMKNGCVGYYAEVINEDESKIVECSDFLFLNIKDMNYLLSYEGKERNLTLPTDYNGEEYVIGKYAFFGSEIKSVVIPDKVISISESAFEGCEQLHTVSIGAGVAKIGRYAFMNCLSLTSITIPEQMTQIEAQAFFGCEALFEVVNNSELNIECAETRNGHVSHYAKTVRVGQSEIFEIDGYRFITANGETYLLKYVGEEENLLLPDSIEGGYDIYKYAFSLNESIKSAVIPKGVSKIGESAFSRCKSLASVALSHGIKEISSSAFSHCSALGEIQVPDSTETIGSYAFQKCSALVNIKLGEGLKKIGCHAFDRCYALEQIELETNEGWLADGISVDLSDSAENVLFFLKNGEKELCKSN